MAEEVKKLYRSRTNRMLAGICGGLGEYTHTDPTIWRILAVLVAFMGAGILIYPILWIIIPEAPEQ